VTTRQRHRQHGNPLAIRGPLEVPDWLEIFGRRAPFAIDVGFGPGMFLVELARQHPEWNVLGIEIRTHWVADVRVAAAAAGVSNLHALLGNANEHLEDLVPDNSTAFVSLNFPDPWFKRRHRKRRVLRVDWLDRVAAKLMAGGELHYMTDFQPAAQEALKLLEAHPAFEGSGGFAAASTTGIPSEREETHLRRGHAVYRLLYRRRG